MQAIILRDALWWAGAALDAILALRLWEQRLARRYPVVAVYLCFDALFRAMTGYLGFGQKWLSGKFVWVDRKSTRLNSSHIQKSRMPSSA